MNWKRQKFSFVDGGLRRSLARLQTKYSSVRKGLVIWSRRSVIAKDVINRRVYVYNGCRFISLLVRPEMVGYKYGMFVLTKKLGRGIHRRRKTFRYG